jgi:hypothetical protein
MTVGNILHLGVGLYLLWFLAFFCWRSYRLDALRDELFQVRNELFDYAATGAVSFDDPAYWLLRQRLNGLLRFAHTVSFGRVIISVTAMSTSPEGLRRMRTSSERWRAELEHVGKGVREKLLAFESRAGEVVAKHLITGSPILICTVLPYLGLLLLRAWVVGRVYNPMAQVSRDLRVQVIQDEVAEQQNVDIEEVCTATA